jgi:hypothetical protein
MDRLEQALAHRSTQLQRPWQAKTSAGWMLWNPADGSSLDDAIARADALLYRDKRSRKESEPSDFAGI